MDTLEDISNDFVKKTHVYVERKRIASPQFCSKPDENSIRHTIANWSTNFSVPEVVIQIISDASFVSKEIDDHFALKLPAPSRPEAPRSQQINQYDKKSRKIIREGLWINGKGASLDECGHGEKLECGVDNSFSLNLIQKLKNIAQKQAEEEYKEEESTASAEDKDRDISSETIAESSNFWSAGGSAAGSEEFFECRSIEANPVQYFEKDRRPIVAFSHMTLYPSQQKLLSMPDLSQATNAPPAAANVKRNSLQIVPTTIENNLRRLSVPETLQRRHFKSRTTIHASAPDLYARVPNMYTRDIEKNEIEADTKSLCETRSSGYSRFVSELLNFGKRIWS